MLVALLAVRCARGGRCAASRRALAAHGRGAGADHGPTALDGLEQRDGLGNRLPWQRGQRESGGRRGDEEGQAQDDDGTPRHAGWAGPRHAEPFPRGAVRRLQPSPRGAGHPLQLLRCSLQSASSPAGDLGKPGHDPGDGRRARPPQPGSDPLQAMLGGLYGICLGMQRTAEYLSEVRILLVQAWLSRTLRIADMPRAVWLLTAPVLIPMVDAIWAADKSA